MSWPRVLIMAVVLEGRPKSEVARDYGVSRHWVQTLVARYLAEGDAAFEPRSRRPRPSPLRTPGRVEGPDRRSTQAAVRGTGWTPVRRPSAGTSISRPDRPVDGDDLADPVSPRLGGAAAAQAAQVELAPVHR